MLHLFLPVCLTLTPSPLRAVKLACLAPFEPGLMRPDLVTWGVWPEMPSPWEMLARMLARMAQILLLDLVASSRSKQRLYDANDRLAGILDYIDGDVVRAATQRWQEANPDIDPWTGATREEAS